MKSLDNSASSMLLLFCELMFAYLWMFILHNVLKPCLFYRLGSVPVYRYMHNFLGQMEFERVPCLTLHGNVPHNHIVHHLVWPAEFLKFSSGQYSKRICCRQCSRTCGRESLIARNCLGSKSASGKIGQI
jgi:hypothetical protein